MKFFFIKTLYRIVVFIIKEEEDCFVHIQEFRMKRSEGSKWQGSLSQAALCRDAAAIGSLMVPFDDRPDHHDDHGDDGDDDDDYDDDY